MKASNTMVTIKLNKSEYDTMFHLVEATIMSLEERLSKGILEDDASEIGDATARMRIYESLKSSLLDIEHS